MRFSLMTMTLPSRTGWSMSPETILPMFLITRVAMVNSLLLLRAANIICFAQLPRRCAVLRRERFARAHADIPPSFARSGYGGGPVQGVFLSRQGRAQQSCSPAVQKTPGSPVKQWLGSRLCFSLSFSAQFPAHEAPGTGEYLITQRLFKNPRTSSVLTSELQPAPGVSRFVPA